MHRPEVDPLDPVDRDGRQDLVGCRGLRAGPDGREEPDRPIGEAADRVGEDGRRAVVEELHVVDRDEDGPARLGELAQQPRDRDRQGPLVRRRGRRCLAQERDLEGVALRTGQAGERSVVDAAQQVDQPAERHPALGLAPVATTARASRGRGPPRRRPARPSTSRYPPRPRGPAPPDRPRPAPGTARPRRAPPPARRSRPPRGPPAGRVRECRRHWVTLANRLGTYTERRIRNDRGPGAQGERRRRPRWTAAGRQGARRWMSIRTASVGSARGAGPALETAPRIGAPGQASTSSSPFGDSWSGPGIAAPQTLTTASAEVVRSCARITFTVSPVTKYNRRRRATRSESAASRRLGPDDGSGPIGARRRPDRPNTPVRPSPGRDRARTRSSCFGRPASVSLERPLVRAQGSPGRGARHAPIHPAAPP